MRTRRELEVVKNFVDSTYSNFGNKLIVDTNKKYDPEHTKLGFCFKHIDPVNGGVVYKIDCSKIGIERTDFRIMMHEYAHIYLGHMDNIHEELDVLICNAFRDHRPEILNTIMKNCGIDEKTANRLIERVIDDPNLNHELHNIAMDMECNSSILSKEDVEEMEMDITSVLPKYEEELLEKAISSAKSEDYKKALQDRLQQMEAEAKIKLIIPERYYTGKDANGEPIPFPNDLSYPDYLIMIILHIDQFVKMMVSIQMGENGDTKDITKEDIQNALAGMFKKMRQRTAGNQQSEAYRQGYKQALRDARSGKIDPSQMNKQSQLDGKSQEYKEGFAQGVKDTVNKNFGSEDFKQGYQDGYNDQMNNQQGQQNQQQSQGGQQNQGQQDGSQQGQQSQDQSQNGQQQGQGQQSQGQDQQSQDYQNGYQAGQRDAQMSQMGQQGQQDQQSGSSQGQQQQGDQQSQMPPMPGAGNQQGQQSQPGQGSQPGGDPNQQGQQGQGQDGQSGNQQGQGQQQGQGSSGGNTQGQQDYANGYNDGKQMAQDSIDNAMQNQGQGQGQQGQNSQQGQGQGQGQGQEGDGQGQQGQGQGSGGGGSQEMQDYQNGYQQALQDLANSQNQSQGNGLSDLLQQMGVSSGGGMGSAPGQGGECEGGTQTHDKQDPGQKKGEGREQDDTLSPFEGLPSPEDDKDHMSDTRGEADKKRDAGQIQAGGGVGMGRGNGPDTVREVDKFADDVDMALNEVLNDVRSRVVKSKVERDVMKLYNRGIIRSVIAPSLSRKISISTKPKLVFLIDISGSMDTRLIDRILCTISRSLKKINRDLRYDIITWSDYLGEHIKNIDPRKPYPKISCGGGTQMAKGMKYFKEHYGPEAILILISDFCDSLDQWHDVEKTMPKYSMWGFNYGNNRYSYKRGDWEWSYFKQRNFSDYGYDD